MDTYKVILAKKETVYGQDATPTETANAIVTRNFQSKPVTADKLDRNLDLPSRGAPKAAATNKRSTWSYEVELAGSGSAGTAPPWMELFEACGMAPAVLTATTKAEQKFAAAGVPVSSLSQYHWKSNQKRIGLGARGTLGLTFRAGAYPFASLNFMGLLPATPVANVTPPTPVLTRWKDPVEVNKDNTVFTIDGYAAVLRELTITADANLSLKNLVGARYVAKGNHALNVRIVIDAVDVAVRNHFTAIGGALLPLQLIHGVTAGNIVQLDSANLQIFDIDESEEDEVLVHTITGQLSVVAGQDDLLITGK